MTTTTTTTTTKNHQSCLSARLVTESLTGKFSKNTLYLPVSKSLLLKKLVVVDLVLSSMESLMEDALRSSWKSTPLLILMSRIQQSSSVLHKLMQDFTPSN